MLQGKDSKFSLVGRLGSVVRVSADLDSINRYLSHRSLGIEQAMAIVTPRRKHSQHRILNHRRKNSRPAIFTTRRKRSHCVQNSDTIFISTTIPFS